MAGAVDRAADRADAGVEELAVVGEALVAQRVELVDGDDVRRQPLEVGGGRPGRPGRASSKLAPPGS